MDPDRVKNINDIDLSDPLHLKIIIQEWNTVESLSEQQLKVKDLFMELEEKWLRSPITDQQRAAIRLYLIEGYTQREAGDRLGMGTRAIANSVNDGINTMAAYRGSDDRQLAS